MRGCDVHLRKEGRTCSSEELEGADEVIIHLRGSKTDKYNQGSTRNHFKGSRDLCPVAAAVQFSHSCRKDTGEGLRKASRCSEMRRTILSLLHEAIHLLVRFGDSGPPRCPLLALRGPSALWVAFHNSDMLKRYGHQTSSTSTFGKRDAQHRGWQLRWQRLI